MLRYGEHQWALIHGRSRIEVNLYSTGKGKHIPQWNLAFHLIAAGPEWRRCEDLDRPHMSIDLSISGMPPGDWHHLSDMNFWNIEPPANIFEALEAPFPDEVSFYFTSSLRDDHETRDGFMPHVHWRVVATDGALFTIELAADFEPFNSSAQVLETVSAIPGQAAEPQYDVTTNGIYLLETLPFGHITTTVPHNAPDPLAYAEELSRRLLNTSHATYMTVEDYKDSEYENLRNELLVKLHFFGYRGD